MIRMLFIIIISGMFFSSCGIKSDPEYKSQIINNSKTLKI